MINKSNKEILEKYYLKANRTVTRIMRYSVALIVIMIIANTLGIFRLESKILWITALALFVGAFLPTFLYDILKVKDKRIEYFLITAFSLIIGLIYILLSFHIVILFVLPVVISCLHNRKSYTIYAVVITTLTIITSYIIGYYCQIYKTEVYGSLEKTICYGIIPNILQFLAISIICICISSNTRELIEEILDFSEKVVKNKNGLHSMVTESDELIGARNAREVVQASVSSLRSIIASFNGGKFDDKAICYSGICMDVDNKEYCLLDNNINEINEDKKKKIVHNETIEFSVNGESISIPINKNSDSKKIDVTHNYSLMCFYDKNVLSGYIIVIQNIDKIGDEMIDLLQILYNNIDKALTNVTLNHDILSTQIQLVCSLAEISEFKSEQFGQHIKRVGEYMKVVGEELHLSTTDNEYLSMASMLHDVGKLIIPAEILDKPGKLTDEEFEIIKTHVNVGNELLENCPGDIMKMAKDIAYHHHEKWDGTGYMKLKGEEINFYARYVAVIDVFDALVSERSYKKAWTPKEAYDEIVSQRGRHFAPDAVDLFKNNYDKFLNILNSYPDECSSKKHTA